MAVIVVRLSGVKTHFERAAPSLSVKTSLPVNRFLPQPSYWCEPVNARSMRNFSLTGAEP